MGVRSGKGVMKDFDPNFRRSINFGYIIIPEDVDREQFINRCLRIEKFSILVESFGGVVHNCIATKSAIRDIKFPLEGEKLGSAVSFFTEPDANICIITGVISKFDETEINKEEVLVFKRSIGNSVSIFSVDGNGKINVEVIGKGGSLDIDIRSDDSSSEINMRVKGSMNLISEGNVNIRSIDGELIINSDKNMTIQSSREIVVLSDKLLVHGATESMVKGDTLKQELDKTNSVLQSIINVFNKWVPVPSDGGSALKVAMKLGLVGKTIGNFDKIKSDKSFLE